MTLLSIVNRIVARTDVVPDHLGSAQPNRNVQIHVTHIGDYYELVNALKNATTSLRHTQIDSSYDSDADVMCINVTKI